MGALTTRRRWTVAAIALAVGLSVVGCAGHPATVTRFDDAHVDVRLWIEGSGPDRTLVAEFDPFDPTAHLYGMDLPDGGIDGAGRPTRLAVVGGDWRPVGAVTASAVSSEIQLAGFDRPFSIYPDGPVTLRQAIHEVRDGPHDDPVDVTVTFMSCSAKGTCFAPVDQEPLVVPIH
jgi:hypothetical protein